MKYAIGAVSRLTGIPLDTLRAWERRYGAVTPARDGRGRLYSDADIARLRLLRAAVETGHAIGRVAAFSNAELRTVTAKEVAAAPPAPAAAIDTRALREALTRFDAAGVDREVARFAATLTPDALLGDVVMPLLSDVGAAWHLRRTTVAHEHLLSATLRSLLGSLLRVHTPARRHGGDELLLLFATPAGERHELGTLGAAMLAAARGIPVVYLGPDLPAEYVVTSAAAAGARAVVVGVTRSTAAKTAADLRTLARELPEGIELWLGGPGARRHAPALGRRAIILDGYEPFSRELTRISAR